MALWEFIVPFATRLAAVQPTVLLLHVLIMRSESQDVLGVDCNTAPIIKRSVHTLSQNGTLFSAVYTCISGYKLDNPGYISATCNNTGNWTVDDDSADWSHCREHPRYLGCKETVFADLTEVSPELKSTPPDNLNACLSKCLNANFFYAARQGSKCYCFKSYDDTAKDDHSNSDCTQLCSDKKSFCGETTNNLYSIYQTFNPTVSVNNRSTLPMPYTPVHNDVNCAQLCKGLEVELAFYLQTEPNCYCLTEVPPHISVYSSKDKTNDTGELFLTELKGPVGATCEDLFDNNIVYHGVYYLQDGTKQTCVFYDNKTVCDQGWIGYDGGCYLFVNELMNASAHFENCRLYDSLLASIGDEAEMDFIHAASHAMSHIPKSEGFYLGLYDTSSQFSYMWSDETQLVYRPFEAGKPNNILNQCIIKLSSSPTIRNVPCTDEVAAICEKRSSTPGCAQIASGELNEPVMTSDTMLTPLCFETCRSLGRSLSVTSNTTCHCYNDLNGFKIVNWDQCDILCSNHPFQMCGGINDTVFITQDQGQPHREGCELMILEGMITNVTVQASNGSGLQELQCSERAGGVCPLSWLDIDGRCYRFFPESNAVASFTCQSMGGYLSVFETDAEKLTVIQTLGTIPPLMVNNGTWAMGLFFYRPLSSKARHTNGAWVQPHLQAYAANATFDCSVFRFPSGAQLEEGGDCSENPFICEKGSDYLGCYNVSLSERNANTIITGYPEMTVRLCLEACKPTGKRYAGLNGDKTCMCVDTLGLVSNTKCTNLCASMQSCGTWASYISAYRIDYTFNASSCQELFDQGVLLNGLYTLGDGQDTWCGMKDSDYLAQYADSCTSGDSCDYTRHRFGLDGDVFSFDIIPSATPPAAKELCDGVFEPASIVASLQNKTKQSLVQEIMAWSLDVGQSIDTLVGALDAFGMWLFTWSNGDLFRSSEMRTLDEVYSPNSKSRYLKMSHDGNFTRGVNTEKYHVTCARDATFMGCYKATNITHVSSLALAKNYRSVSVVLCRQLCQAVRASHFLMSEESCVCHNEGSSDPNVNVMMGSLLVPGNHSDCNTVCPGHPFQTCAKLPYFRYHELAVENLASSCKELYDNFVVYNATYLVNGNETRCGLDDCSVTCPTGFIASNNKCYAFERKEDANTSDAAVTCFSRSSYLASPTTIDDVTAISNLIGQFSQFRWTNIWLIGFSIPFQYGYWVSSLGYMLPQNHTLFSNLNTTDKTETCIALNTTSRSLENVRCDSKLPFICESNSPYVGCATIDGGTTIKQDQGMTLQQCISFCYGLVLNVTLAAVRGGTCSCLESMDYVSDLNGTCNSPCPGQNNQLCGSTDTMIEYYSIYNINAFPKEYLMHSCDTLFSYGVVLPQQYRTNDSNFQYVKCFKYSQQSDYILANQASVTISTSESKSSFISEDVQLHTHKLDFQGWKGDGSSNQFIQINLDSHFVLEGMILWDPDPGYAQTLTLYVSVDGSFLTEVDNITLPFSNVPFWYYLPSPVVARNIRLEFAVTGEARLSLELIGYSYLQHEFEDSYLGCHNPHTVTSQCTVFNVTSLHECRDKCHNYSLAALSYPDLCECMEAEGMRDLYDVNHCTQACWSQPCGQPSDNDTTMAIYTTSDFTCKDVQVNNSRLTVRAVKEAVSGVVTTGTTYTFTCRTGYELNASNIVTPFKTTCHNQHVWDPVVDGLECVRINCGDPPKSLVVNITTENYGTLFEDSVSYSCGQEGMAFDGIQDLWNITCTADKSWIPEIPDCTRRICTDPPPVTLAALDVKGKTILVHDDLVTYTCVEGARFNSDHTEVKNASCLSDGQWSMRETECIRYRCPSSPPTVGNAQQVMIDSFHYQIECNNDHVFSDRTNVQRVSCSNDTLVWTSPVDTSCVPHVSMASPWLLFSQNYRLTTDPLSRQVARSVVDCALTCLNDNKCFKFSFRTITSSDTTISSCILSLDGNSTIVHGADGVTDAGFVTYKMILGK